MGSKKRANEGVPLLHAARLERLAQVAVRVGLNPKPGQEIVVSAPIEAAPLVGLIAKHAFQAGATVVTPVYSDDRLTLAKFKYASSPSFDVAADWLWGGIEQALAKDTARLTIVGNNPMLLDGQDSDKITRANTASSKVAESAMRHITNFDVNWNIVAYVTDPWAKLAFPGCPIREARAKLWDAVFKASRVDGADPIAGWAAHNAALHARMDWLNAKRFSALHFCGPGTNLRVGLATGHEWKGGAATAKNGVTCNPNIPTEEVFTTPDRLLVQGYVSSTKPLAYAGTLIKDIYLRFDQGRVVQATASAGKAVLQKMIEEDEGASRLGEVALVPHSSPIAQSNVLFYSTLFDENSASHAALGKSYAKCMLNGLNASQDELLASGANTSRIHVDFMIGSQYIDVEGIYYPSRVVEPLMRNGEWVHKL